MSRGHIRPRSVGSWELKYDIGRDPLTGRRITKFATVHGAKRDAQRELRRLLKTVDDGVHSDPGKLTVADQLRSWLAGYAENVAAPKTRERWGEIIEKHLIPALGGVLLRKLRKGHAEEYYAIALVSGRRDGKGGLSRRTVNHHHRVLHQAIGHAVPELLPRNPIADAKPPKPDDVEVEVLDDGEVATLLKAARPTRLYTPILVALTTGLRRGELLALSWNAIDLDAATLKVERSLEQTKAGLRFKAPKSKRGRRKITLPGVTVEALRQHKVTQLEECVMLGLGRPELVFTRYDGALADPGYFSKAFSRIAAGAGLRVTLHGLRHTHATQLLNDGIPIKVVSERLGHATAATTLNIYAHALPNQQEEAAVRVDASIRKALEG